MYDDQGNPLWYASQQATPVARRIDGAWAQYGGGQAMGAPYRAPTVVNPAVAPFTLRFDATDSGFLTLPGRGEIAIRRFRF
jgi:hypothetical protein